MNALPKTSAKEKANVGLTLMIFFLSTLVTGIMLHLKKHGIVVEPRPVLKMIHWISGLLMTAFAAWHLVHFHRMACSMKFGWFKIDTIAVVLLILATLITGLVKLLSPVKIPHLGLWHYGLGIAMGVVVVIHLIRGIPMWLRLNKAK